jgi:hypothetical protein
LCLLLSGGGRLLRRRLLRTGRDDERQRQRQTQKFSGHQPYLLGSQETLMGRLNSEAY